MFRFENLKVFFSNFASESQLKIVSISVKYERMKVCSIDKSKANEDESLSAPSQMKLY